MNLLTPFFLIGGLAVALPVIFHLIRRTTRTRQVFSSLLFLQPSPPRLTRRSRLEHLLLLALRCLVLCLLAAGFARPFINKVVPPAHLGGPKRMLVLLDTSASMRRGHLWADARKRAEAILDKTTPEDQAAILTFDRELKPLVSFEEWNATAPGARVALAKRKIADAAPGWSGTQLGAVLVRAAEMLSDPGGQAASGPAQLVVVSDFQEGSHLEPLQGYEWPKGIELGLESVQPPRASNASLQWLADSDASPALDTPSVRVRVSNAADSRREQFKVGWARTNAAAFIGTPMNIYVPPGQSRMVAVPLNATAGAERILLQGDDEDFDNSVFVVPPQPLRLEVLYFGSDSPRNTKQPLYFLQCAFQDTRRQSVRVVAHGPDAAVSPAETQPAALLVVTAGLSQELADALHSQIAAGKTALAVVKDEASARTIARLLGRDSLTVQPVRPANYAMLAEIDFRHPLFAPFADPRFGDFTKIHFWQYRRVELEQVPGARALAKFDDGSPALLEVPVGKGRVFLLTSGWEPEESQLALSTKFVPLLYSLLEQSGASSPPPPQFHVGESIPLPSAPGAVAGAVVRLPDGKDVPLAAGVTNFSQTEQPGIYSLAGTPSARFAVNLDPAESRTVPVSSEEFERLGAPVSAQARTPAQAARSAVRLQRAELENQQKLWRWFVLATLGVLAVETWLAGRQWRSGVVPSQGALETPSTGRQVL